MRRPCTRCQGRLHAAGDVRVEEFHDDRQCGVRWAGSRGLLCPSRPSAPRGTEVPKEQISGWQEPTVDFREKWFETTPIHRGPARGGQKARCLDLFGCLV